MNNNENSTQMKQWVQCWNRAGVQLEQIRQAELPSISTSQSLLNLAEAFESCCRCFSPKPYSGLIDQQAWFKKYADLQKSQKFLEVMLKKST